jgi:Trk-type K+ transport system membrane component
VVDRETRRLGDKVFRVSVVKPWRIAIAVLPKPKVPRTLSPLVLLSLLVIAIALGTLLLALPVSNKAGDFTSGGDALFTATSAASDTGHVVVDTGDYWTPFGQAVILFLIQIGGFSFMIGVTLLLLMLGGRIGIRERVMIGESTMGVEKWGGREQASEKNGGLHHTSRSRWGCLVLHPLLG